MAIQYLRDVGTSEDECWVPCAKGDPGAIAFISERSNMTCIEPMLPVSLARLTVEAALLGYIKGLLSSGFLDDRPTIKRSLSDLVAQLDAARIKDETR